MTPELLLILSNVLHGKGRDSHRTRRFPLHLSHTFYINILFFLGNQILSPSDASKPKVMDHSPL